METVTSFLWRSFYEQDENKRTVEAAAVPGLGQKWDVIVRDAYLHEPRHSFVLISQELTRFLNSAEIAVKWTTLNASRYRTSNMKIF